MYVSGEKVKPERVEGNAASLAKVWAWEIADRKAHSDLVLAINPSELKQIRNFFDAVDKLREMEVEINQELLTIMLLYSLPPSYGNFRCAIETRDDLSNPESLKIKITEESDARKTKQREDSSEAMLVSGANGGHYKNFGKKGNKQNATKPGEAKTFPFKSHKCKLVGHKTFECKNFNIEEMGFLITSCQESALKIETPPEKNGAGQWLHLKHVSW